MALDQYAHQLNFNIIIVMSGFISTSHTILILGNISTSYTILITAKFEYCTLVIGQPCHFQPSTLYFRKKYFFKFDPDRQRDR